MSHNNRQESPIKLGRGRPFTREAQRALWQAIASGNPANDWAKGRVLTMALTVVVMVWGLGGLLDLVVAELGAVPGTALLTGGDAGLATGSESEFAGKTASGTRLPNDLFKIPQAKKRPTKKAPRTNPAELLGLIELQGLLGGTNPRAIVLYKRSKKTVTVTVGDDLGEFKVMEIRERGVILKWRDELFELSL